MGRIKKKFSKKFNRLIISHRFLRMMSWKFGFWDNFLSSTTYPRTTDTYFHLRQILKFRHFWSTKKMDDPNQPVLGQKSTSSVWLSTWKNRISKTHLWTEIWLFKLSSIEKKRKNIDFEIRAKNLFENFVLRDYDFRDQHLW